MNTSMIIQSQLLVTKFYVPLLATFQQESEMRKYQRPKRSFSNDYKEQEKLP